MKVTNATTSLRSRLFVAGLAMLAIFAIGTLGYFTLGQGRWNLGDCAYMTIISLTTTGYGEVLSDLGNVPYARFFTGWLLIGGAGVVVYFVSALTTFLVEGEFLELRRRKKMYKEIEKLSNHIIVCGAGGTGRHVVEELLATRWPFIMIDTDSEKLTRLHETYDRQTIFVVGDATDDNILLEAGIKRAHGIVASLPDDKGNLFVVVTARELNPNLRIVAKVVDTSAIRKLAVAGADSVVSVNTIGGLRLASEMIRPNVVNFIDKMMHEKDKNLRFEEVTIPRHSPLVNKRLADSDIRKERNLLIVAVKDAQTEAYIYSPGPDFKFQSGMTLILLGETASVQRLRNSHLFQEGEIASVGEN